MPVTDPSPAQNPRILASCAGPRLGPFGWKPELSPAASMPPPTSEAPRNRQNTDFSKLEPLTRESNNGGHIVPEITAINRATNRYLASMRNLTFRVDLTRRAVLSSGVERRRQEGAGLLPHLRQGCPRCPPSTVPSHHLSRFSRSAKNCVESLKASSLRILPRRRAFWNLCQNKPSWATERS